MARIDRLADEPRSVLQTAAVLGRRFPLRLLAAVWPGRAVQPRLDDLIREEFLVEAVVEGEGGFEFKHALTHDVAYQSVGAPARGLHESAGLCLEELYAGRTEEVDGLLAHHWSRTDARPGPWPTYSGPPSGAFAGMPTRRRARCSARRSGTPSGFRPGARPRVVELSLRLVDSMYFLGQMDESEELLAPSRRG